MYLNGIRICSLQTTTGMAQHMKEPELLIFAFTFLRLVTARKRLIALLCRYHNIHKTSLRDLRFETS